MSWVVTEQRVQLECDGRCGNVDWADLPDVLLPEVARVELMAKAIDLGWGGESDGDIHLCPSCGEWGVDDE